MGRNEGRLHDLSVGCYENPMLTVMDQLRKGKSDPEEHSYFLGLHYRIETPSRMPAQCVLERLCHSST